MRVSAVVALGAVSLWGLSLTTPGDADTVRSSARTADVAGNNELRSLANTPTLFDPSSESYFFESAGLARAVSNDSGCKKGDTIRGSGGSGSKRRHAPAVDPCRHGIGADSTVTFVLRPFVAPPGCSGGGVQPAGQPAGGSSGKKRHATPMGQTPCRPRAISSSTSDPLILGMSFGLSGTDGVRPPNQSTNPGGGSNGKHRHSPPSPPQIQGAAPEVAGTPEPGGLILLSSGLLIMGLVVRRRTMRARPPAR